MKSIKDIQEARLHATLAEGGFLRTFVGFANTEQLKVLLDAGILPLWAEDPNDPAQIIIYGYVDLDASQEVVHPGWEQHAKKVTS